jgi:16S rRNA (cytidine1402-2'-O)-methyltransferase
MSSSPAGSLYLLPNVLGDTAADAVIPAAALNRARSLEYLIAEDPKSARAFLKRIGAARLVQSIRIERLDHNSRRATPALLLEPVLAGPGRRPPPRPDARGRRPRAACAARA